VSKATPEREKINSSTLWTRASHPCVDVLTGDDYEIQLLIGVEGWMEKGFRNKHE
jgi:hypothetical protein